MTTASRGNGLAIFETVLTPAVLAPSMSRFRRVEVVGRLRLRCASERFDLDQAFVHGRLRATA